MTVSPTTMPVPMTGLVFPRGNDIVVTASFPDISDGTGMSAEFYYKPDRTTDDNDPSVKVYESTVDPDPDNAGATLSTFDIPAVDNGSTGSFWWRVDVLDVNGHRRTADCGPLLVEAV
jgi:hypothetical protein